MPWRVLDTLDVEKVLCKYVYSSILGTTVAFSLVRVTVVGAADGVHAEADLGEIVMRQKI